MAVYTVEQYVEFAELAITDLVRTENAVLWREAEAKISDVRWPSVPAAVNPHHLTTARAHLLGRRVVRLSEPFDDSGTRLLIPGDERGRKDAIRTASRRKRLLHGRMERWARATSAYPAGLIGEAGERVTHKSLAAAAVRGTRPVIPGAPQIATLLGQPVEGGALDSAAWADQLDEHGRATESVLCPIEVKNIRHWIYPRSYELFQLLHKAALLQQAHPDQLICPVLITRKRSWTADQMSRDLGFRIIDLHKQFVLPVADVDEAHLAEVRDELGFRDLVRTDDADATLVGLLGGTVRTTARPNAERWREHGGLLADHYAILREANLRESDRGAAMEELREEAEANGSVERPW
jgi:hypothetical protein